MHVLSVYSLKQKKPYSDDKKDYEKYEKSGLKKEEARIYLEGLLEYMENKKPYLNGDLTIENLAKELKMQRHHLTQIINTLLNKNFFNFINEYRVKEAAKQLENNNDKKSVLEIAYNSGFNSKSVFNKIFKEYTGKTPSQYRKGDVLQ